ncbi:TPA: hypothetical protein HA238_06075 [Candidatus Micrarchaeota archaeon]|nr:hypothetical protein [Candidatus Micrarchaeota archaeon]
MQIKTTGGKIICQICEKADTLLARIRGLMFSEKRNILFVFPHEGIQPIHSLFVFFPFHAVYLDKEMQVVEKFRVEPFEMLVKNTKPAKYLLEIPEGVGQGAEQSSEQMPQIGDELCLDGKC